MLIDLSSKIDFVQKHPAFRFRICSFLFELHLQVSKLTWTLFEPSILAYPIFSWNFYHWIWDDSNEWMNKNNRKEDLFLSLSIFRITNTGLLNSIWSDVSNHDSWKNYSVRILGFFENIELGWGVAGRIANFSTRQKAGIVQLLWLKIILKILIFSDEFL